MKWLNSLLCAMTVGFVMLMQIGNAQTIKTVGGTGASYATLYAAFTAINNGTITGTITLQITGSTSETSSAKLNASGSGSANYASVTIYPTVSGLSISGSLALPLIDLNGADNVTIDGRVNATGSTISLTISNTSTSSTAGTSTIRFINDATNNIVKYCTLKGASTSASNGILLFSTTTGTTGNDAITIDDNNITSTGATSRPINAIYSSGTSAKTNSGDIISNNNIYDFFSQGTASYGINLYSYTTGWTISGNSFYETNSFTATASVAYTVIQINNASGSGFSVTGNYIGGTSSQCGGGAWTKSSQNSVFIAIYLNVATGTTSSVEDNTISNINWSNSSSANWTGISIAAGDVNIGDAEGNVIGSSTGTGSVTVTGAATGTTVYGINIASTGTVVCQNNSVGSVTAANGSTLASNFYGIYRTAAAGTTTINNNTIGSFSTSNSIYASSASTSNVQGVYGIYSGGTGTVTINGNTIANMWNGTTNTTTSTAGVINGITSVSGTNTISNNTIHDLNIANANTSSSNTASVCGIALTGATLKTVNGNTIYNLSNSYASYTGYIFGIYFTGGTGANSASNNIIYSLSVSGTSATASNVIGLNFNSGTGANVVSANFIYSLSVNTSSTTATIYGIKAVTGVTTYSNNIITLGGNTTTTVYGIYDAGAASQNSSLYFNTVYINGSLASGATTKSYCLYSSASSNTRDFRNNIFVNARSTASGSNKHYAAYFNYAVITNLTVGYNDYYAAGTGGVLGYFNATNKTSLPIVTGQDGSSLAIDPAFSVPGGTAAVNYYPASALPGVSGTGITTDYTGLTRTSPPKMGALESDDYVWQGSVSTDFSDSDNWTTGVVPASGSDIAFAPSPSNHCFLDQNRTLNNITNAQSAMDLVTNGKQLTITGNLIFSNGAQIDATSSSSAVVFSGSIPQSIPSGGFVNNSVQALNLNNTNGLTLNGNLSIEQTLTLTSGTLNIGANTLSINGVINVTTGTLAGGSSTNIVIGGSGSSTTLPSVSLNNLTLNRSNGISLGGAVTISGTLTLSSGTLITGGYLTLLSTATQTALIDGSGTGQVSGNVTLQRYIASAFGYKYISSPFQSATVGQFSPYVNLSATFPTFYRNDETQQSNGWISYTSSSNPLTPTLGYAANLGTSKSIMTISLTGAVNSGTMTAPVLYNHNNPYTLGFNLVGNPYPSPVDWNASSGWTRTNIDNAVYYFNTSDTNQYYGTYSSYINGVSSDGIANNIIPAMQGFFIHVSNGTYPVTGTLVLNNGVRINNLNPVYHKSADFIPRPMIRLTAGFTDKNARQDAVVVYFDDSATLAFDKEFDALKMMNTDYLVPNIFAFSSDEYPLSISAIPSSEDSLTSIPLGFISEHDGLVSIKAGETGQIPALTFIYLEDREAGIYHDLRINPEYRVFLSSGSYKNRFALIFSLKDLQGSTISGGGAYIYSSGEKLYIDLDQGFGNGGELLLYDILGQTIFHASIRGSGLHEISLNVGTGIYVASFTSDAGKQSKKVFITSY